MAAVSAPGIATEDLERYRRELTGYCYRMLGSVFDADDAAQETLLRAWRAADRFEGRSSLRTWLYRIATNVCLDLTRGRARRERPMDLGPSSPADPALLGPMLTEHPWLTPVPDARALPAGDPAEETLRREGIRLAFVAALQYLPARQRAVLILCEVLSWPAAEVAELLGTSVASVNSALQRARATMAKRDLGEPSPPELAERDRALLAEYVEAFERYDIDRLAGLLRDDVVQSMPPFALWLEGRDDIASWMLGPGIECRGSRLIVTEANGCGAFAQYRPDPDGGYAAWGIHVIEIVGDQVQAINVFLGPELFAAFDLPAHLPA